MSNITKENSVNNLSSISFKYVESGGLTNNYLVISFDSETNNLKVSTDISGADLTQKPLDESEKTALINTITKNNFFNTEPEFIFYIIITIHNIDFNIH